MIELSQCPACGEPSQGASTFLETTCVGHEGARMDVRVERCGCGHGFVDPQPTWEELGPFYQSDYHVFSDPLPDETRVDRLIAEKRKGDRLNHARVATGGRYLDIGCGLGEMVAGMARLGVEAEGVEPSKAAVERTRPLGLKIHEGMLHEAKYSDACFDSMSMYHVLEHTPQPVEVLAECRRILKPGGNFTVAVPNFESRVRGLVGSCWSALDLPRHLQHFTRNSLGLAAERAGLEVVEIETESIPTHVEAELAGFLRRRLKVPARLTLGTRVARPLARRLAKSAAGGRGESIVAQLRVAGR